MKKYISAFLAILCCFSLFIYPAFATDSLATSNSNCSRIDLPDGGYIIEEVTTMPAKARTTNSTAGTKTSTRYTASGHVLYAVEVTGYYKYTGSSSWATSSAAAVYTYDSNVTYVSKSASYTSNYATATGRITYLGDSESRIVKLYCDKNGNLS